VVVTGERHGATGLTVAEGAVIVASNSELAAVDTATGARTWRLGFDSPVVLPPTASAGTVYTATLNATTRAVNLYAVDAPTGERRWTASTGDRVTHRTTTRTGQPSNKHPDI